MDRATDITPGAIEAAITTALATIAPEAKNVGPATRLMGSRAVVDSMEHVGAHELERGRVDSLRMNVDDGERPHLRQTL